MEMYGHPVPLTAYILIGLYKIETDVSGVNIVAAYKVAVNRPGPRVIKLISWSAELSKKFKLLINCQNQTF